MESVRDILAINTAGTGERTMDPLQIVIILALIATVFALFLGLLAMSGGGATDSEFSTPLMWARVGFQSLTLLLLILAVVLH